MKYKACIVLSLCSMAPMTWSMESLDDTSLANTTGQDGLTIGVGVNEVSAKHLAIIDTDGIANNTNYSNRTGLVIAGANSTSDIKVTFQGANATNSTLQALIDVDAGNGNPFANVGVSFGSHITGISIAPLTVYLAGHHAISTPAQTRSIFNGTALHANVKPFLRLDDVMAINFAPGNSPRANIQLGHSPQGQMIRYAGAIDSICNDGTGCTIEVVDGNTSIGFDFKLTGYQPNPASGQTTLPERQMFSLDGFYTAVQSDGVVIGNTGASSKFDTQLNNVMLGGNAVSNPNVFRGVPNGSIGSIGLNGVSITNMQMKVSGL